jgi:hypothetical protein
MSATKVMIVVLVLFVAAFVVIIVMGAKTNGTPPKQNDPNQASQTFNSSPLSGLGSLLANFGPKVSPKQLTPAITTFNLAANQNVTLKVAADSSNEFRNATFQMQQASGSPCASITYQALNPPAQLASQLGNQCNLGGGNCQSGSNPYKFVVTVLNGGGTITLQRNRASSGACTVKLQ